MLKLSISRRPGQAKSQVKRSSQILAYPLRRNRRIALLFAVSVMVFPAATAHADCIAMEKAAAHIGANKCVSGRVVKVTHGERGTTYLNFCEDYRLCPFQIVVFAGDLRHVGDVRQLAGKTIEVHGEIKAYDGRPEIILRRIGQLKGGGAGLPPLPKDFDVEKKGRYSAGKFSYPKKSSSRAKHNKRQSAPIQTEDPAAAEE